MQEKEMFYVVKKGLPLEKLQEFIEKIKSGQRDFLVDFTVFTFDNIEIIDNELFVDYIKVGNDSCKINVSKLINLNNNQVDIYIYNKQLEKYG